MRVKYFFRQADIFIDINLAYINLAYKHKCKDTLKYKHISG